MTQAEDAVVDDRLAALLATDEDLQRLLAGDWVRYRTSPALQELTWEAHSTCATINRIYYDDPAEAQRLFQALVPGAGDGIDFRPPISIDYGMRLVIGDRTFLNADFLIIGGGSVTIGADCLIGPRCAIYTPNHAKDVTRRLDGWELPGAGHDRQQRLARRICDDHAWRHHRRQQHHRSRLGRHEGHPRECHRRRQPLSTDRTHPRGTSPTSCAWRRTYLSLTKREARERSAAGTSDCCALRAVVRELTGDAVQGTEPVAVPRIASRSRRADPSATARKLGS